MVFSRLKSGTAYLVQIPRQHHLEAEPGHLPRPEPAIQDADIGMDSHQDDLVDAFLLAEVVDLLAALADTVEAYDVDGRMLAGPGVRRPFNLFTIGSSHPPAESSMGKSRSSSGTRGQRAMMGNGDAAMGALRIRSRHGVPS